LEFLNHGLKGFQVLEEVSIVEVTALQILEYGGKSSRDDGRHQSLAVG
jgi:hypothetical protein